MERIMMVLHSGETSHVTGDCRCENCNSRIYVKRGTKIPKCPNCGNNTFESGKNEQRDLENF